MSYNPEDVIEYVPELGDNRDLPEGEQVWVELVPMTAEDERAYQRTAAGPKPGSREQLDKIHKMMNRILCDRIVSVHNYTDIRGKPIETGEDFSKRAEPDMYSEVYNCLTEISRLRKGLRKN